MQLDRRQRQLLRNIRILQLARLINSLALDPFGGQAARCNRRATAKGLEFGIDNLPIGVHLDLQLHHITASRSAHQASAHSHVLLVQGADIARILVVVDDLGWGKGERIS